jgi:hypothetical protein
VRTRTHISDDHDHPDQANYDPTTPGGALLRSSLLAPDGPRQEQRANWSARVVDPRTITTSRTTDLQETPWTRH